MTWPTSQPFAEARVRARLAVLTILLCSFMGCGSPPTPAAPLTRNRDLEAFRTLAAEPNSDKFVLLVTAALFMSGQREWDGVVYFGKLASEQPARRALFLSLQGLMQARVAADVPLLRRVAWVEDAIGKLDAGVAADPVLGRFARGLVFADLPERFGKAHVAVGDLQFVLAHTEELPAPFNRGLYRGLAAAYRTTGDQARSEEMLARSGLRSLDEKPQILGDVAVGPVEGFRFGTRRMVKEADGVYVAEGYDFANISFIVGDNMVVAVDAGTSERTAREALAELRKITQAPIKYLILTHGHWDHAGGVAALREPGTRVIASASFPRVLARSQVTKIPFHDFFGDDKPNLAATVDRLVSASESIIEDGVELTLLPGPSGETEDALYVMDMRHGILFVGDAFMPYLGAPFAAEGSAEGYRDAIDFVLKLHPRRLVHGHPPLTALFTMDAMPGLRDATAALYERTLAAAVTARPLADILHDDFLPPSLRATPKAVVPFMVVRDQFVQRLYQEHAGYWQADGTGMDHFTQDEWGRALNILAGENAGNFAHAVDRLLARGDAPMALQLANLGIKQYPTSDRLRAVRTQAVNAMRERASALNPFRFIVYSEWAGATLSPVVAPTENR
ncbi:MBL fold metallo-hydrolase [Pendulispora rubella]|uniref:MBL fold metallo-hydrolase n=1 Tax=Pendulispora rubella TaxID=2741070 RepID=A0ABZ2KSX4_9BACT